MKKLLFVATLMMTISAISGCQKQKKEKEPVLNNYSIHHDDEFGGAYIDISIASFNDLGFKFGDSVSLTFSNDVKYENIGYYSGYYVPAGQELLVGYPGYDYIKFCINYGDDIYVSNHFDENTTVTITIYESGKFIDIEETLSISYSDDINEYDNREQFANFREINAGNIKDNLLYRGASPIDNRRKRAETVDIILEELEIKYDIDLADNRTTIDGFYQKDDFKSEYFQYLDEEEKVLPLGMAAAYKTEDFSNKMKTMFLSILNNDGPYYIHCLEGKDRTGYVCMVIEALCGASYEELIEDYFITYHNYYGIEKGTKKYDAIKAIHIDEMIRYVFDFNNSVNLLTANYHSQVNNYLLSIGLQQEEIDAVQNKLSR